MADKLPINLLDLLHQQKVEGERIEYKAGWNPDPILRTVCAFANDFENLGGGYVVIGQDCDSHGRPVFPTVGLPSNQLDNIQQELLAGCQLIQPPYFPALSVEVVEGRNLMVLWAPGGQTRPYKVPQREGQTQDLALLHPPLQQYGRGQGRDRARVVKPHGQGTVGRPLCPNRRRQGFVKTADGSLFACGGQRSGG